MLSQQILDLNKNVDVIFITAFNQYAVEAFELQVYRPQYFISRAETVSEIERLLINTDLINK